MGGYKSDKLLRFYGHFCCFNCFNFVTWEWGELGPRQRSYSPAIRRARNSWNLASAFPQCCYAVCVLLLCHGSSGLVVRVPDWYSEGLGFKSHLVPEFFCGISLSASLSQCIKIWSVYTYQWFASGEDTDSEQPTFLMEVFIVLLPNSQFRCSSHSMRVLVQSINTVKVLHLSMPSQCKPMCLAEHDVVPVCSTSI